MYGWVVPGPLENQRISVALIAEWLSYLRIRSCIFLAGLSFSENISHLRTQFPTRSKRRAALPLG